MKPGSRCLRSSRNRGWRCWNPWGSACRRTWLRRSSAFLTRFTFCARLAPIYQGSTTEDCVFKVKAEAADGSRKVWNGSVWHLDRQPRKGRKSGPRNIVLHDETALQSVPALVAPLGLKNDSYLGIRMRVTKKFPDLFSEWLRSVPPRGACGTRRGTGVLDVRRCRGARQA